MGNAAKNVMKRQEGSDGMRERATTSKPVRTVNIEIVTDHPDLLREAFIRKGWSPSGASNRVERIGTAKEIADDAQLAIDSVLNPKPMPRSDSPKAAPRRK